MSKFESLLICLNYQHNIVFWRFYGSLLKRPETLTFLRKHSLICILPKKISKVKTVLLQKQPPKVFYKKKLSLKETPTKLLCCKYCKIFKNTYLEEHLRTTASIVNICCIFFSIYDAYELDNLFKNKLLRWRSITWFLFYEISFHFLQCYQMMGIISEFWSCSCITTGVNRSPSPII